MTVTPQDFTIGLEVDPNRSYGIPWSDALASGDWIRTVDPPTKPQPRRETILDVAPGIQRFYRGVTP